MARYIKTDKLQDYLFIPIKLSEQIIQRQLPTDHDYAGGHSRSIREYQSDQTSCKAASTLCSKFPTQRGGKKKEKQGELDRSLHISSPRCLSFILCGIFHAE